MSISLCSPCRRSRSILRVRLPCFLTIHSFGLSACGVQPHNFNVRCQVGTSLGVAAQATLQASLETPASLRCRCAPQSGTPSGKSRLRRQAPGAASKSLAASPSQSRLCTPGAPCSRSFHVHHGKEPPLRSCSRTHNRTVKRQSQALRQSVLSVGPCSSFRRKSALAIRHLAFDSTLSIKTTPPAPPPPTARASGR